MQQFDKFDINDIKSFDVKDYVLKVISHWKLFLVTLLLGLIVAFFINKRKPRIYSLNSLITVKEEQNPLFTSSTNIAFNWGGPSDKVETIIAILNSRTHNEKVVEELKYYINYYQDGNFRLEDVYGKVPFEIELDSSSYNLLNIPIKFEFINEEEVELSIKFENDIVSLTNYISHDFKQYAPQTKEFSRKFSTSGIIETPFCNFKIKRKKFDSQLSGNSYYVVFRSFNGTVGSYQGVSARTLTKGTSLIELELKGTNKKKIEDYINTTVEVLDRDQRDQKIEYAKRTKDYIDDVFSKVSDNLADVEKDLGEYKRKNNVYDSEC